MASVLLLGATSDMAVAIARKFAADKYDIILAGRDMESLQALQTDIQVRYNVKAVAVKFDVLDYSLHKMFYQQLPFKPDISICVVGYLGDQQRAITDWNEADKIIATDFTGPVSILNVIAEDYALRKSGIIVGISSVAGERVRQSNYFYGSAKAGFTAYLSGLRNSLHKDGVHVVTVLPGFVYTKMTSNLKLPAILTATPNEVSAVVKKAVDSNKNVVYVKWFWRWIMLIIKLIPESMFKKMKL